MYLLLDHEYQTLITKWIDKDQAQMFTGGMVAIFAVVFHVSVNFDNSGYENGNCGLASLLVSALVFINHETLGMESWQAAIVVMLISFFSSWKSRNIFLRRVFTVIEKFMASPSTWRYNVLIYPFFVLLMYVLWIFYNSSDMGVQEQDYCFESLVIFILFILWVN